MIFRTWSSPAPGFQTLFSTPGEVSRPLNHPTTSFSPGLWFRSFVSRIPAFSHVGRVEKTEAVRQIVVAAGRAVERSVGRQAETHLLRPVDRRRRENAHRTGIRQTQTVPEREKKTVEGNYFTLVRSVGDVVWKFFRELLECATGVALVNWWVERA